MPEVVNEKLHESISELLETERTYISRLVTTYKVHLWMQTSAISAFFKDSRSRNSKYIK